MTGAVEIAESCFANRLRTASRAISRHYDAVLKPLDLKVSQLSVLAAASMSDGQLTIVELANSLGMDRSTLSRNFSPLERRGFIQLGPEERHRARRVALTPNGTAILSEAYKLWKEAQISLAAELPAMRDVADSLLPLIAKFG